MTTKPAFLFKGKEAKGEEKGEKKMGKAAYAKGEKSEGKKSTSPAYKYGSKVKK